MTDICMRRGVRLLMVRGFIRPAGSIFAAQLLPVVVGGNFSTFRTKSGKLSSCGNSASSAKW